MHSCTYEINMTRSDYVTASGALVWTDEWGCVYCWGSDNKSGVEYNYCHENGEDYSAFYKMYPDDEGFLHTDSSKFIPYEIDWSDPNWKEELKIAAVQAYYQFYPKK